MEGLKESIAELRLTASVQPVADYDAGIAAVRERQSDVLFGDREKLLQAVQRSPDERDLRVLTRHFTFAALALALPRNDDDFRLAVDRALRTSTRTRVRRAVHGELRRPDTDTVAFFRSVGVPADVPIREPR